MSITSSMFDSIKSALASENERTSSYNDILKTEPGNTYTVRLLPYMEDPNTTFFHYYQHGWVSFATGQYVSNLSLQTFNERDPIAETRYRLLRTGTDEEKEKAGAIKRVEKWLVNVYVINDPVNPDNNGTVKVLRAGKQLYKIIKEAIEGEDADELGPRIFDLGPNGVNFRIKVEMQGDYPTYVSSKFGMPSSIEELDDEDARGKVYEKAFDLTKVFPIKTYDELKQMLDEHFFCVDTKEEPVQQKQVQAPQVNEPTAEAVETSVDNSSTQSSDTDEELEELLKGIDL